MWVVVALEDLQSPLFRARFGVVSHLAPDVRRGQAAKALLSIFHLDVSRGPLVKYALHPAAARVQMGGAAMR